MFIRLNSVSWQMIFLIGILVCGAVPVSATVITLSPDQVAQGDTITINIIDLSNNSTFTLMFESIFVVTPGKDFSFRTTDFDMPISLINGELSAYTENTQKTTLKIKKGSTEYGVGKKLDANGIFTISEVKNIPSGKFDYISIDGISSPDKDTIVAKLQMSGNKKGPDTSKISYVVTGIENGIIYITVIVDGSPALVKKVIVGSGLAASTSAPSEKMFYSVDRKVSLKTSNLDHLELISVQKNNLPATWIQINKTYMLLPETQTFPSEAILSFTVPNLPGTDFAYFIGRYDGTQWSSLPSSVSGDTMVSAPIRKAGTYGLMAYKPENIASEVNVPTTNNAPASVQKTPKIASIAQTSPAAGKETQAPASIIPVCGALIATGLLIGLFRKRD
jgi:hypothetical protein